MDKAHREEIMSWNKRTTSLPTVTSSRWGRRKTFLASSLLVDNRTRGCQSDCSLAKPCLHAALVSIDSCDVRSRFSTALKCFEPWRLSFAVHLVLFHAMAAFAASTHTRTKNFSLDLAFFYASCLGLFLMSVVH